MELSIKLLSCILLAVVFVVAQGACPSKCTCAKYITNCSYVSLQTVPNFDGLKPIPSVIDLSGNDIINIESTDFNFSGSDKVKSLFLNRNFLIDVNEYSFKQLKSVSEMSLSQNVLESLPSSVVADNHNLLILDLSKNFFDINTPQLQSDSLEILDLSASKISKFTEENVKYLPNLKVLNLSLNNVKRIPPTVFARSRNLVYVNLEHNIWECSNTTIELFNYLTSNNLTVINEPVKCVTNDRKYFSIYTATGPEDLSNLDLQDSFQSSDVLQLLEEMQEDEDDSDYAYDYDMLNDELSNFDISPSYDEDKEDDDSSEGSESDTNDLYNLNQLKNESKLVPSTEELKINASSSVSVSDKNEHILVIVDDESAIHNKIDDEFSNMMINVFTTVAGIIFFLTFFAGFFVGIGMLKNAIAKRRELDMNGSTAKLMLTDDFA